MKTEQNKVLKKLNSKRRGNPWSIAEDHFMFRKIQVASTDIIFDDDDRRYGVDTDYAVLELEKALELKVKKKEKPLSPDDIRCRAIRYVFNIDPQTYFRGLCPLHWTGILAMGLSPVVYVGRKVGKLLDGVTNPLTPIIKNYEKTRVFSVEEKRKMPLQPPMNLIVELGNEIKKYNSTEKVQLSDILVSRALRGNNITTKAHRYAAWFKENPDWLDTYYVEAKQIIDEHKIAATAARKQKELREAKFRKLTNQASSIGTIIFKILIPVIVVIVLFGLWGFGVLLFGLIASLFAMVTLKGIISFLIALGGCLVIAVALFFGIRTISAIITNFMDKRHDKKQSLDQDVSIDTGPSIFEKSWDVVCLSFAFVLETIRMTYKAECPMIVWGDETKPIQKRNKDGE